MNSTEKLAKLAMELALADIGISIKKLTSMEILHTVEQDETPEIEILVREIHIKIRWYDCRTSIYSHKYSAC